MVYKDIGDVRKGSNSTTQIAAELENLVGLYRTSKPSRRKAAGKARSDKAVKEGHHPSQHFGGGITNILRLCRVDTEDVSLYGSPAKKYRRFIQQHIEEIAEEITNGIPFIITPMQVKKELVWSSK